MSSRLVACRRLEAGGTLKQCIRREVREETGLEPKVRHLLYVCDRIEEANHTLHITLDIVCIGGMLRVGEEPESDENQISEVRMVSLGSLVQYGLSEKFQRLAMNGFPDAGATQAISTT